MLIVYWPITIKFRTCEQTSKPQTNYRCCLWFSYLAPYWLISRNTITFHKYFWCSRFCEFHSNEGKQVTVMIKLINVWYSKTEPRFGTLKRNLAQVKVIRQRNYTSAFLLRVVERKNFTFEKN